MNYDNNINYNDNNNSSTTTINTKNINKTLISLKIPSFLKHRMIRTMEDLGPGGIQDIAKLVIKTYIDGHREYYLVYNDIGKNGDVQKNEFILNDISHIASFRDKPEYIFTLKKENKKYIHWQGTIKKRLRLNMEKNEEFFRKNNKRHRIYTYDENTRKNKRIKLYNQNKEKLIKKEKNKKEEENNCFLKEIPPMKLIENSNIIGKDLIRSYLKYVFQNYSTPVQGWSKRNIRQIIPYSSISDATIQTILNELCNRQKMGHSYYYLPKNMADTLSL